MRGVRRFAAGRRLIQPPLGFLVGLSLLFITPGAFAQSTIGEITNEATGRSLADAVAQNEKAILDREVLGRGSIPPGATGVGVTGDFTVFPTGRLRHSEHKPRFDFDYAWQTDEASAFVNIIVPIPGIALGGQVKLIGFAGHNWLSVDLKSGVDPPPGTTTILRPEQK